MRLFALIVSLALQLALIGCGQSAPANSSSGGGGDKLIVVCTTTMITDLARQLAGDDIEVRGIMKVGEDPHVYDVRPRDAQLIAEADLVLANGFHLESTLGHVIDHNVKPGAKVVRLAEDAGIEPLGSQATQGAPDPHCWFNVGYFRRYAEVARDALIAVDPDHAAGYRARAESYLTELDALHAWVVQRIATVPRERRVMITSHDAFAYFGRTYDVDVYAVIGISTEQAPKPQDIARLESLVHQRGVKALFIETSVSATLNQLVEKVAQASGATIGGTLYSDSLGGPDTPAGTYIGMVRHNVETIVKALQ